MHAMAILEQAGTSIPEIPRFDDGMINVQELIRIMAKSPHTSCEIDMV